MLKIHAKIGTMSQSIILVGWKQNYPRVGDIIKFRSFPYERGEKWRRGRVDKIEDMGWHWCLFISYHFANFP